MGEMQKVYEPKEVEQGWDEYWDKIQLYSTDNTKITSKHQKFVMMIPPPNVTGTLHLGHALTCAIEDTLTRWHRMQGHQTLWLPGVDHAGISC